MAVSDKDVLYSWIDRLLYPLLLLAAVVAVFVLGSAGYQDTKQVLERVQSGSGIEQTKQLLERVSSNSPEPLSVLAALEVDTIAARNNRAASLLVTRTWIDFFVTLAAVFVIMIGSALIVGRVNMKGDGKASAEGAGFKGAVSASSPGLLLVVLGVGLLSVQYFTRSDLTTTDGAAYAIFSISDMANSDEYVIGLASPKTARAAPAISGPSQPSDAEILGILEEK
ncbi:hypothetical protein [Paracoccus sp. (in: a-proteobacteria)]|uniref:hypothetical protein n=1 Tax=Paracoccus sp. TaxID=267 RepID=UPI003A84FF50